MKMRYYFSRHPRRFLPLAVVLSLLAVLVAGPPALAAPAVTISPASGAIGTLVSVQGTVFDSYVGDSIHVFFDDTEISGSPITVNDTGAFAILFNIPDNTEPGRHWVEARSDTISTSMLARNFFVLEEPQIELDVIDGPVGTKVTVSGLGFYANRTVTVYYQNIVGEKMATETASAVGEFSYQFTIPLSAAGNHRVTASNDKGESAEDVFQVLPSISLNLAAAGPGELLTLRGAGFASRAEVDVNFGTRPVATARTDEFGNFEVRFNIPEVQAGIYDVRARDENGNLDRTQFTATAGANLDKSEGAIGSRVTVSGSGFKAGKPVTIDYDNLRVATVNADNNGDFSAGFNVPVSNSGSHVITASDGETTKQFAFTVESEAPPLPASLLPADSSETRAKAYLDWQDVTDASPPVTYTLQVATDQNFASVVLEKKGLTSSEYTLSEDEILPASRKEAPYYWRVKAKDAANNESEWSAPRSFFVSAPATPLLMLPVPDRQANTPVFFSWQAVTSLSPPVTYQLQVATDLSFTNIVLDKAALAEPKYTPTATELPEVKQEAPYYWRVRAGDAANNASEWSAPWSFYTGSPFTLRGWLLYTLIGIVIVAVGYLAFRAGRRTAYGTPD